MDAKGSTYYQLISGSFLVRTTTENDKRLVSLYAI